MNKNFATINKESISQIPIGQYTAFVMGVCFAVLAIGLRILSWLGMEDSQPVGELTFLLIGVALFYFSLRSVETLKISSLGFIAKRLFQSHVHRAFQDFVSVKAPSIYSFGFYEIQFANGRSEWFLPNPAFYCDLITPTLREAAVIEVFGSAIYNLPGLKNVSQPFVDLGLSHQQKSVLIEKQIHLLITEYTSA